MPFLSRFLQNLDIAAVYHVGRLRQLAGVAQQGAGLVVHFVLGPVRGKFMVEMLITREAANCRRMQAQSRSPTDLAVDDGRQHLALQPGQR